MSTISLELEDELTALLRGSNQPLQKAVRELMVLELYRRGSVSSGKASELLGMNRFEFIKHASRLGIPFYEMNEDEWAEEVRTIEALGL